MSGSCRNPGIFTEACLAIIPCRGTIRRFTVLKALIGRADASYPSRHPESRLRKAHSHDAEYLRGVRNFPILLKERSRSEWIGCEVEMHIAGDQRAMEKDAFACPAIAICRTRGRHKRRF